LKRRDWAAGRTDFRPDSAAGSSGGMQKIECNLTIFFEEPFRVGVCERVSDGLLEVCKITFGAEPKDYELHEHLLKNWHSLRFSPPVKADKTNSAKINPKRMQRAIKKQLQNQGIGTKSQLALKLQHEENKIIRKRKSREQKEAEKQMQFDLRQQKKKEKHKGH
jgi:hypothetical protein